MLLKLQQENLHLKLKLIEAQGQILQMQHTAFSQELKQLEEALSQESTNEQEQGQS